MNINLTHTDEVAIVDFVKDYEELYAKTHNMFKNKARKECLLQRFSSSQSNQTVQDLVQIPKDLLWKINPVQVWPAA